MTEKRGLVPATKHFPTSRKWLAGSATSCARQQEITRAYAPLCPRDVYYDSYGPGPLKSEQRCNRKYAISCMQGQEECEWGRSFLRPLRTRSALNREDWYNRKAISVNLGTNRVNAGSSGRAWPDRRRLCATGCAAGWPAPSHRAASESATLVNACIG